MPCILDTKLPNVVSRDNRLAVQPIECHMMSVATKASRYRQVHVELHIDPCRSLHHTLTFNQSNPAMSKFSYPSVISAYVTARRMERACPQFTNNRLTVPTLMKFESQSTAYIGSEPRTMAQPKLSLFALNLNGYYKSRSLPICWDRTLP